MHSLQEEPVLLAGPPTAESVVFCTLGPLRLLGRRYLSEEFCWLNYASLLTYDWYLVLDLVFDFWRSSQGARILGASAGYLALLSLFYKNVADKHTIYIIFISASVFNIR